MFPQHGFDFSQLDAVSPQFDLKICPPHKFNMTIGQPASQVPGLVHPRPVRYSRNFRQKPLGGQLGTVQIPPSDAIPRNVNFTHNTRRYRLQKFVQNINANVSKRFTNHWAMQIFIDMRRGRHHRTFRGTIHVKNLDFPLIRQHLPGLGVDGFPTGNHQARIGKIVFQQSRFQHQFNLGWHPIQNINALLLHVVNQCTPILADFPWNDNQRMTMNEHGQLFY